MVEMTESAAILHNATEKSLVLMDEVGRGTSTFDGLALAWAIANHLIQKNRSLNLFATHYFELTRLALEHKDVANVHLDAVEHKDTRGVPARGRGRPGEPQLRPAGRRARRRAEAGGAAGAEVSAAARGLEPRARQPGRPVRQRQAEKEPEPAADPLREEMLKVNPDELTPREALELLYRLKKL